MSSRHRWVSWTLILSAVFLLAGKAWPQDPDDDDDEEEEIDNPLARADWFYEQRAYPGTQIPPGARLHALAELRKTNPVPGPHGKPLPRLATGPNLSPNQWTSIGPTPIGTGTNPSAGRVTAIAVDPRNKDVVYAGVSEGGVWKTTNGGQTWVPLTDGEVSMAVGAIALDPSNPDTVYAGTGESNNSADSYYGAGILKSTDGGATWTQLAGPFVGPSGGAHIGALAVYAPQPNILLAAVSFGGASGIWRSADGAVTWSRVLSGNFGSDVLFDPATPGIAYAALGSTTATAQSGVYKSADAGVTWIRLTGTGANILPTSRVGRIALAIAPSDTQVLLASIADATTGNLLGLFRTTDAGASWTAMTGTPGFCNSICWYANVVQFSPANKNIIYAGGGGLGMFGTSDGGGTWRKVDQTVHVDHHALAFSADGTRLYNGNDGGMWRTEDLNPLPSTWINLNATFSTALFNPSFSMSPADPNIGYGGTQDNNTLRYNGNPAWTEVACGDGGWTVMDPALPDQPFTTCQNTASTPVQLFKGPPGGSGSWLRVTHGIDQTDPVQFYPPLAIDPDNGLRLYYGTNRVYLTKDGGGLWQAVSPPLGTSGAGTVTAIAASPSNPDRVWAGVSNGNVWVGDGVISGNPGWTLRITGLPRRYVTQLAVDPGNADIAYVTFSGFAPSDAAHVFVTQNGGIVWRDLSGAGSGFPNVPANDIVIDPDIQGTLYVATDMGVLRSVDAGNTWAPLGTGLPNVVVQAIRLHRKARLLRAATHGRSMWDLGVPVAAGSVAQPVISGLAPVTLNAGAPDQTLAIEGTGFTSNSKVLWNGVARVTTFVSSTRVTAAIPAADIATPGRAAIIVANPPVEGGFSGAANLPIGPAPVITPAGIVSSATGAAGAFAPGSIIAIYGSNLASGVEQAVTANLPATLANTTVTIGGSPAPLFFVSPGQINLQVPWFLTAGTAAVAYNVAGVNGQPAAINLTPFAPALFSTNSLGKGQGSILIAGTATIAAPVGTFPGSRPVERGGYLAIYCTGLGPVSPTQSTGSPASLTVLVNTLTKPKVTIGQQPGEVTFSGLTPGTVGLYQVNVKVPDSVPPGDAVPLQLNIGGIDSNIVTVAVQ